MHALASKTILVTGGTGSIGREIVRQVLDQQPHAVRVLSRNEYNQYVMRKELSAPNLRFLLGDVRDRERLMRACEDVDIIFHAAALKHVELCEYNPFEAVKTNVMGAQNVVDCALASGVQQVVGISTDKAVAPVNTMGATKLLAEKIILSANQYKGAHDTRFSVIRFGNVVSSNGSVLPLFRQQIRDGLPLTLTHPDARRFFMSIPQAVELALKAAGSSTGGEIFILKMPVFRMGDVAAAMMRAHGETTITTIGLLPGEKLHEALMTPEEAYCATNGGDMWVLHPLLPPHDYPLNPRCYDSTRMELGDAATLEAICTT